MRGAVRLLGVNEVIIESRGGVLQRSGPVSGRTAHMTANSPTQYCISKSKMHSDWQAGRMVHVDVSTARLHLCPLQADEAGCTAGSTGSTYSVKVAAHGSLVLHKRCIQNQSCELHGMQSRYQQGKAQQSVDQDIYQARLLLCGLLPVGI